MADTKVSALTALTGANVATGDLFTAVDVSDTTMAASGTNKKITADDLVAYLQTRGMPIVRRLNSQHSISSVTATEVTDLEVASLVAGTYVFQYDLIIRSATATVSPMYGVNFTGTAAVRKLGLSYWDAGPMTAGTATADDVSGSTLGPMSGSTQTAFSTTTPNLAHHGGVGTINVDVYVMINGIMIVTATGNLELWHGSETASATSIEIGSSLSVIRTA